MTTVKKLLLFSGKMVTCRPRRNVSMVKDLGIIQMANGILILILGSSASFKFREEVWINEKSVIFIGLLRICIAGVFGSLFTLKPNIGGLNCTHMVFCLLSTCIAVLNWITFAIGLRFYNECRENILRNDDKYALQDGDLWICSVGARIYACLVTAITTELVVNLIVTLYCYQALDGFCRRAGLAFSEHPHSDKMHTPSLTYTATSHSATNLATEENFSGSQQQQFKEASMMENFFGSYSSQYLSGNY